MTQQERERGGGRADFGFVLVIRYNVSNDVDKRNYAVNSYVHQDSS